MLNSRVMVRTPATIQRPRDLDCDPRLNPNKQDMRRSGGQACTVAALGQKRPYWYVPQVWRYLIDTMNGFSRSDKATLMALNQKFRTILAVGMGLMMISTWSGPVVADSHGSQVYKKACKKCHGKQGLGKKSKVEAGQFKYPPIYEMSEEDLLTAMTKYREMWQTNTYNKNKKRMAKAAGRLSDDEMTAVVAFITAQLGHEGE